MGGNVQVLMCMPSGDGCLPKRIIGRKAEIPHSLTEAVEKTKLPAHLRHQLLGLLGFEVAPGHDLIVMRRCRAATESEPDSIVEKQTKRFNRTATPPRHQPKKKGRRGKKKWRGSSSPESPTSAAPAYSDHGKSQPLHAVVRDKRRQ
jgi:hypothetical protein